MHVKDFRLFTGASVIALTAAGAVQAQDVYGGFGLSSTTPNFAAPYKSATATLGVLWGDTALKYGVEGQISVSSNMTNLALRGIASYDFGRISVFGTAGAAALRQTVVLRGGGTTSFNYTGTQFGLGADFDAGDRTRVRLEANHENLTGGRETDTLSLGVMFDF